MNARILRYFVFICFPAYTHAAPPSPEYALVWSDEFDGPKLDAGKWSHRRLGPYYQGVIVKDSVSFDNKGHLVFTTRRNGNQYETGSIGTQGKFESRFGYYECRVKLQTQIGHASAFWLQSPKIGEHGDAKSCGTEIDIYEYCVKDKDVLEHNLHWEYGPNMKSAGVDSRHSNLQEGFHVLGLQWTPKEYVFFVDGKEVWRTTEAISGVKQYIVLSAWIVKWMGDISKAKLPDHAFVDYVRVYQRKEDAQWNE